TASILVDFVRDLIHGQPPYWSVAPDQPSVKAKLMCGGVRLVAFVLKAVISRSSIRSLAAPVDVDLKAFAPARLVPDAQGSQLQGRDSVEFRELRPRPPDGSGQQYSR